MPHLDDSIIIKALSDEVIKIAQASFGQNTHFINDSPERINRRYSFMFRYHVQKENGEKLVLLAKIPHQSWMTTIEEAVTSEQLRDEVQFEYRVMKSIAHVISNSGEPHLTALNPLGCIVEWNAIVTEEIRLAMLKDYLVKPSVIFGMKSVWVEFSNILRLAGRWLKVIHEKNSTNSQIQLRYLDIYDRVHEELLLLEKKNIKYIHSLRTKFSDVYDPIASKEILLSASHDDYHLGNIFVTPEGRVGALDPNWKENHSIYNDLSKLLIDPLTRKMQVICHGLTIRPFLRRRFENEVLKGYFGNAPVSNSILWFYCAFACLEKWRLNEETLEARKSPLFFLVRPVILLGIRRYFSRLIDAYLEKAAEPA